MLLRMQEIGIVLSQIILLWIINKIGYFIVGILGLPIPGNVVGMVLLLLLLITGKLPLAVVERGASLLIKHLGFFFIPFAVGLMTMGSVFVEYGIAFFITIIVSIFVGMYTTGRISQFLKDKKEKKRNESRRHPA